MRKLILAAVAGTAFALAGCNSTPPAPTEAATESADASADASSEAPAADASSAAAKM